MPTVVTKNTKDKHQYNEDQSPEDEKHRAYQIYRYLRQWTMSNILLPTMCIITVDLACCLVTRCKVSIGLQDEAEICIFFLQDEPEALCFCKETQVACGSDNRTYESVCQMNEASVKSGSTVYLKHWGPCRSGKTPLNAHTCCFRSTPFYLFSICYLVEVMCIEGGKVGWL
jgi:hypothetical protein